MEEKTLDFETLEEAQNWLDSYIIDMPVGYDALIDELWRQGISYKNQDGLDRQIYKRGIKKGVNYEK